MCIYGKIVICVHRNSREKETIMSSGSLYALCQTMVTQRCFLPQAIPAKNVNWLAAVKREVEKHLFLAYFPLHWTSSNDMTRGKKKIYQDKKGLQSQVVLVFIPIHDKKNEDFYSEDVYWMQPVALEWIFSGMFKSCL